MRTSLRSMVVGAALVVAATFTAPAAHAQIGFVVQGTYAMDTEAFGAGGGVNFGLGSLTANSGISAEATFDYFFTGDVDGLGGDYTHKFWQLNGNALYDVKSVAGLYVGAGVNYTNSEISFDDDNDVCDIVDCDYDIGGDGVGLNILSGYKFSGGKGPFVQARFSIGGSDQLYLTGGFRF